jgi:hypothetical protein
MLTEMIHGTEFTNGEDRMTWKLGKKEFTVKSFYNYYLQSRPPVKVSTFAGIESAS